MDTELHEFLCEVCGKAETLTNNAAFESGWDYPPFMGTWGTVCPRTCGDCGIEGTAWWAIAIEKKTSLDLLSEKHQATVKRILAELDTPR